MRLNGEGDCINWKDFLDWIMFDNLYLIGAGPFEVRGGGGEWGGVWVIWFV